jgi:hypothetical protein
MDEIVRQFPIEKIQYACVAQESGPASGALHLHVQIVLKYKANKKTWFLDHITGMSMSFNDFLSLFLSLSLSLSILVEKTFI